MIDIGCNHNNDVTFGFFVIYHEETEVFNYCIHDVCMTCGQTRHYWAKLYYTSNDNIDKHRFKKNSPKHGGYCCMRKGDEFL